MDEGCLVSEDDIGVTCSFEAVLERDHTTGRKYTLRRDMK